MLARQFEVSLCDEIDHVTGVSGGRFTAAYLGLHGRGIFDDFEERFLRRDVQGAQILQLFTPWNWVLLASPFFERSDMIAHCYDRILFEGATFANRAARKGPLIQINATDLATGSPFSFIQDQFDFLCSDLSTYPISRTVAASSAVPGPMSPLTLRNLAGQCGFGPPPWIGKTIELLRSTFESWREVAASWSDLVGFHLVEFDFTKPADPAERLYLNVLLTSFRLEHEAVDRLRAAGRFALEADPDFRALIDALGGETGAGGVE